MVSENETRPAASDAVAGPVPLPGTTGATPAPTPPVPVPLSLPKEAGGGPNTPIAGLLNGTGPRIPRRRRRRFQDEQPHRLPPRPLDQRPRQPPRRHRLRGPARRQPPRHFLRGRPVRRFLGQAGADHLAQFTVERLQPVQPRLLVHHLVEQRRRRVAGERCLAQRGVRQHGTQREDVSRARHVALTEDLLGRHVTGRADGHTGGGEGRGAVGGARDAEVDQPGPVERQHDVRRLDVPVYETESVHRAQRLREPRAQSAHREHGQRPGVGDGLRQRGPGDVPGGHPRHRGIRVRVQHGRRPVAADPPGRRHLAPEAGAELVVEREVRMRDLDRDRTSTRTAPEEYAAHAAGAQPAEDPVRADGMRITRVERLHALVLPRTTAGDLPAVASSLGGDVVSRAVRP